MDIHLIINLIKHEIFSMVWSQMGTSVSKHICSYALLALNSWSDTFNLNFSPFHVFSTPKFPELWVLNIDGSFYGMFMLWDDNGTFYLYMCVDLTVDLLDPWLMDNVFSILVLAGWGPRRHICHCCSQEAPRAWEPPSSLCSGSLLCPSHPH